MAFFAEQFKGGLATVGCVVVVFFSQCEVFFGGDCSVGWEHAVGSLQQLEVSGCNAASREGWLRCGPACSVMEKR